MVQRGESGVGRCLARALASLWRAELAYYDRSGLQTYARYRVQQRASTVQLWILLGLLFDLFSQILNLALNFSEEAAVRTANRLVISLVQPILRSGFLFLEGLAGSRKLLRTALELHV